MKENQLIKYDAGQLEKVKNLIAITNKLLEPMDNVEHFPENAILKDSETQEEGQKIDERIQDKANLTILLTKMVAHHKIREQKAQLTQEQTQIQLPENPSNQQETDKRILAGMMIKNQVMKARAQREQKSAETLNPETSTSEVQLSILEKRIQELKQMPENQRKVVLRKLMMVEKALKKQKQDLQKPNQNTTEQQPPLQNPYHLQKVKENLEANSKRRLISREDFIKQGQFLKMSIPDQLAQIKAGKRK